MSGELNAALLKIDIHPRLGRIAKKIPVACSAVIFIGATIVLLGLMLDSDLLKSSATRWGSIKTNTAICFILCSIAVFFFTWTEKKKSKALWQIPTIIIMLISALTLSEYWLGVNIGIDELLLSDFPNVPRTSHPGRMSPSTAFSFFFVGLALFFMKKETKNSRHPVGHYLAALVGLNATLTVMTYIYNPVEAYGPFYFTQTAFLTSIFFGFLSMAIFFLKLDHSFFSHFMSAGTSGIVARTISITGIVIPVGLGLIRVLGERAGLYPMEIGTAIYTTLMVFMFIFVAWWTAIKVNEAEQEKVELAMKQQALKIEAEVKDKFMASLAHDLRTPLTAAKMSAEMIERGNKDFNTTKSYAKKIQLHLRRTDLMIRDLLDLRKFSSGNPFDLPIEECDISDICKEIISNMELLHGNRFILNVEKEKGFWSVEALTRILENLLSNAVKYGASDKEVTLSAHHKNGRLVLSVHNWGTPISKEDQKKLFELYERSDSAKKSNFSGWGIGLNIARALTEAQKGHIKIESSESLGTTFTVELPMDTRTSVNS